MIFTQELDYTGKIIKTEELEYEDINQEVLHCSTDSTEGVSFKEIENGNKEMKIEAIEYMDIKVEDDLHHSVDIKDDTYFARDDKSKKCKQVGYEVRNLILMKNLFR